MTIFPANTRLKPIALPTEHGGWGFILEPLLLGIAIAPSWTGLLVVAGSIFGFLFRQPIRIIWSDFSTGRNTARTHAALIIGGVYFVGACVFLSAAIAENTRIALPLIAAIPVGLAVFVLDAKRRSRTLAAEILGPVALGSTGAAVVIGGGLSLGMAAVIWALVLARAIPTILYVRARLRIESGEAAGVPSAVASHVIAVGLALTFGFFELVPYVVAIVYLVLLTRACLGLSRLRRHLVARSVGFVELGWGAFTIAFVALLIRL